MRLTFLRDSAAPGPSKARLLPKKIFAEKKIRRFQELN
jgi:hypothetical protein